MKLNAGQATFAAGDLDTAEADLMALLPLVQGHPRQELNVLSKLVTVYVASDRMLEVIALADHMAGLARAVDNRYAEARVLGQVCIARYGLYIGADFTDELRRYTELLEDPDLPPNHILQAEHAYISFAHAIDRDEQQRARASLERMRELAAPTSNQQRMVTCVYLGSRARLALKNGQPIEALALLDELDATGAANSHDEPELSVLRVRARCCADQLDVARADVGRAIDALENAPEAAVSHRIHYGAQLAEILATTLGDVEQARRVYDLVGTAIFQRIRQLDTCLERIPQLGLHDRADADLVRYRKEFVRQQRALVQRVGAMFRTGDATTLRGLLHVSTDTEYIPICSWCECLRDAEGRWVGLGHLVPREEPFTITHGICPACEDALTAVQPGARDA